MAAIPATYLLTTAGDFDLPPLIAGHEYLLVIAGNFGGGQLTLSFTTAPGGAWQVAAGGTWSAYTEARFTPPTPGARLTLSGASSPSLKITLLPLHS